MHECDLLTRVFRDHKIAKHPAMLAVSVSKKMLCAMRQEYVVSIKADGERAFLFLLERETSCVAWLYFRTERVEYIYEKEAQPDNDGTPPHNGETVGKLSILDVEVMIDTIECFDTILVRNVPTYRYCYSIRMEFLRKLFCEATVFPRRMLPKPNYAHLTCKTRWPQTVALELGDYLARSKPIFPPTVLQNPLFNEMRENVKNDGLIFMRLLDQYHVMRMSTTSCLKWKAPKDITVDFHISRMPFSDRTDLFSTEYLHDKHALVEKYRTNAIPFTLACSHNHQLIPVARIGFLPKYIRSSLNCIVECAFDSEKKEWSAMKLRHDKTTPNTLETYIGTLISIEENISFDELRAFLYMGKKCYASKCAKKTKNHRAVDDRTRRSGCI